MPKLPRISSREVIRVLERLGFYQARQRVAILSSKNLSQTEKLFALCHSTAS